MVVSQVIVVVTGMKLGEMGHSPYLVAMMGLHRGSFIGVLLNRK